MNQIFSTPNNPKNTLRISLKICQGIFNSNLGPPLSTSPAVNFTQRQFHSKFTSGDNNTEPVFVNLLRGPGIDSQPDTATLFVVPARQAA
jgi:hypothetical protein